MPLANRPISRANSHRPADQQHGEPLVPGQQPGEPLVPGQQEARDHLLSLGAERQLAGPRVTGVAATADQAQAFQPLGLAGDRGRVDAEPFGQFGDAQAGVLRIQRVQDGQPGLVDVDPGLLQQEVVQPGLLEPRASECSADSIAAIVSSSAASRPGGGGAGLTWG